MKNYLEESSFLLKTMMKPQTFYETNFGFKKMFDTTTDVGQRFLHIGTDPLDSMGIWFLKGRWKTTSRANWQSNQSATYNGYLYYFFRELFQKLKTNGVKDNGRAVITPGYKFLHCHDLYGNEIVVVEIQE